MMWGAATVDLGLTLGRIGKRWPHPAAPPGKGGRKSSERLELEREIRRRAAPRDRPGVEAARHRRAPLAAGPALVNDRGSVPARVAHLLAHLQLHHRLGPRV